MRSIWPNGKRGVAWGAAVWLASGVVLWAQGEVAMDLSTEAARARTVAELKARAEARKQAAVTLAQARGWPVRGQTPAGALFELQGEIDGLLIYYVTHNVNASISTVANEVRNTAPYNVNGQGVIAGVWDGGAVRPTHQEFGGRISVYDGITTNDHATHVAGTIGAAGVNASARGMVPSVAIHSYDWNSDLSEATARAPTAGGQTNAIYLSNHSYGIVCGWEYGNWSGYVGWHWLGTYLSDREDRRFGQYNEYSRDWDNLCFNAPYYLPVWSAGNDRNDNAPAAGTTFYYFDRSGPPRKWNWKSKSYDPVTDPYSDGAKDGGYNTVSFAGVSKNTLTVGAVNDAVSGGVRNLGSATMSTFSCWGPTDDGRIKPDIVANGVGLYSSLAESDSDYGIYSGTSMSAPNATGSAILLIHLYRALFSGQDMRAATLKGLIIHTADDLGAAGPDYQNGWGLMNTRAAADLIRRQEAYPAAFHMVEAALTNGAARSYSVVWNGTDPIRATLSWTDPPGTAQTGLNVTNRALVNDLDLRVRGPGGAPVYQPYVLTPANPGLVATTGDNGLDNVEQVHIPTPGAAGVYTVEVSHKGTLSNSPQRYSLLVSGQRQYRPRGTVMVVR